MNAQTASGTRVTFACVLQTTVSNAAADPHAATRSNDPSPR